MLRFKGELARAAKEVVVQARKQKAAEAQGEQTPPPAPAKKQYIVFAYAWTKKSAKPDRSSESAWFDGFSLHLNAGDIDQFTKTYEELCSPGTYTELSKSGGLGYSTFTVALVDEETFNKIRASKAGIKVRGAVTAIEQSCEFTPTNATYQGEPQKEGVARPRPDHCLSCQSPSGKGHILGCPEGPREDRL